MWRFATSGKVLSTPAIYKDKLLIGSFDHYLYCLDKNSGQLIWKFQTEAAVLATPLIVDEVIYFGSYDSYFYALDLNGKRLWDYPTNNSIHFPAVNIGENIIFADRDKYLYCLNEAKKIIWRKKLADQVTSPLVLVKDQVALALNNGKIILVETRNGTTVKTLKNDKNQTVKINYHNNHFMVTDVNGFFSISKFSFPTHSKQPNF